MDQNFRKRLQKTLCCGELEPEHCSLALTELAVEYFQDLAPHSLDYVDLESASTVTSQDTVSPSSVAMSMVYAKRLQRKRPDYVTRMSSSDLFIISMMMASKYLYDEGVDEEVFNDEWAQNSGLETDEMNTMEMDFLDALDWELYIRKEDFDQAMLSIEKRVALREGMKRGWFSYTDLDLLLDDMWMHLLGTDKGLEWLQVMVVSSAAYVVAVMTMVGSTVLVTNACVGLSSVGLLPVMLPALPTLRGALPSPQPGLHTPPLVDCPVGMSMPATVGMSMPVTGAAPNETRHEIYEDTSKSSNEGKFASSDEEDKPRPSNEPLIAGQCVVDTILSQLMAVLTLKSHLAQFVYAVSDSYVSNKEGNHSQRKAPHCNSDCRLGVEEGTKDDNREISTTDALMHGLCGMDEASADLDRIVGPCWKCRNQKAASSGFDPSLPTSPQILHGSRGWEGCKGLWEWTRSLMGKCCNEICPGYNCRPETRSAKSCWNQATATMHSSLFPDIVIGFSTSMPPPVFAT